MSLILFCALSVVILAIFSQFGGRLQASKAAGWWFFAGFLLVSTWNPEVWIPIADILGVQVVSNFVMAVAIVFLFWQLLGAGAGQASVERNLRTLVSATACRDYALRNGHSIKNSDTRTSVLVVLPCFNEEGAIPELVDKLKRLRDESLEIMFCFVDDGSHDTTQEVLRELAPNDFVSHGCNSGVSGVLMTGFHLMKYLRVDYMVQCDGDGQHPVDRIPSMIARARSERLDLLVASRFMPHPDAGNVLESTTKIRRLGSRIIALVLKVLWRCQQVTDPTSGFRVFSQSASRHLMRFLPDDYPEPETLALLAGAEFRVDEIFCAMQPRKTGSSSLGGWKGGKYVFKVVTALLGLKLRQLYQLPKRAIALKG